MHSTIVYKHTNEKIEQLTQFVAITLMVANVVFLLPALLYTSVNYYILDAGTESFFLFFPTWLVLNASLHALYSGKFPGQFCATVQEI